MAPPEPENATADHGDRHGPDPTARLSRCLGGGVLCPYCGLEHQSGPACTRCSGRLDAESITLSQSQMGPWQSLDRPDRPGAALPTLLRLVDRGSLTPSSIVRGPGTWWCWRYAADVPELAARMGFCHACRAPVGGDEDACPACSARLSGTGVALGPAPDNAPHLRPPARRGRPMAMGVGALAMLLTGLAIGWFIPRHGPQATTAGAPPVVAAPSLPTAPPEPPLAAAPPSTEPQAERGVRDEDLSVLAGAVLAGRAPEAIPERWQAACRRLEGVLRASDRLNALP